MKIAAVTAPDAASDPAHPEHDRWVKDHTLRMEIEHAHRVGIPLRVAESENARLLERSEHIAKANADKAKIARAVKRKTRERRLAMRNVSTAIADPQLTRLQLSPCGRCGVCRRCMRERRVLAIIQKARDGDRVMLALAWEMTACAIDASGGVGRFANLSTRDANRIVAAKAESVCDRSIRWLGEWR